MKPQTFTFYGTRLNAWLVLAIAFFVYLLSSIVYYYLFDPNHQENSIYLIRLMIAVSFILVIFLSIHKQKIEVTEDKIINYYLNDNLVYTNALDNLYYIQAVDIKRGAIADMKFCFNDKTIYFSMPAHLPRFYEPGKYEGLFAFFMKNLKLQQKPHHTIFGVSKYVFVYWNPLREENYQCYSQSKGRRVLP